MVARSWRTIGTAAVAGSALALGVVGSAAAGDHSWQVVADAGLVGLTAGALGTSVYKDDWKGAEQLGLSLAATEAATYGLKHAFPELRPNGDDRRSFPSGHTALSFTAAGYLQQRYGWEVGAPATAVAALVGFARVKSHDHHWYDVVAGAALGEASAFLITRPLNDNVRVFPWAGRGGAGLSLAARF